MIRSILAALIVSTAAVSGQSALAASLPAGLDLRVWLKADDLVNDGLGFGDDVSIWTDASSHGTTFEPDLNVEAAPILEQIVRSNGAVYPAVRFTATGPGTDPANTRLRQTNNLTATGVGDPTNVVEGEDMTLFAVYRPNYTTRSLVNFQTIAGKRGAGGSPWTFGLQDGGGGANAGQLNYIHYGPGLPHRSGNTLADPNGPIAEGDWHVSGMTIVEKNPNNAINFFTDNYDSPDALQFLGAVDANSPPFGNPVDQVTGANGPVGNSAIPEPMVLGGHLQPGVGINERFDGYIAELIIFADALTPGEFSQVEQYLSVKYSAVPEPTSLVAMLAMLASLAVRRR